MRKIKQIIPAAIAGAFALSACSPKQEGNTAAQDSTRVVQTTLPAADSNTFVADTPEIVFTLPNDAEVSSMMAKDSDAYNSIVDDYTFYSAALMERADSLHIKTVSTGAHVLDFVTRDKRHIPIDRSRLQDMEFATYIFNGIDSPKLADIGMDKAFLSNYFKK